jgi:hypothetical protein
VTTLPSWLEERLEELRDIARRREPGPRDLETQQHLDLWEAEQEQWWKEGAGA